MARLYDSKKNISEAIVSIKKVLNQAGTIPPELVRAYKAQLTKISNRRPGLVQFFYEELLDKCPEAVPYFSAVPQSGDSPAVIYDLSQDKTRCKSCIDRRVTGDENGPLCKSYGMAWCMHSKGGS
jgi:hypothetical protein